MNCFDAISLGDSREIYYFIDSYIKSIKDDMCLGPGNKGQLFS